MAILTTVKPFLETMTSRNIKYGSEMCPTLRWILYRLFTSHASPLGRILHMFANSIIVQKS